MLVSRSLTLGRRVVVVGVMKGMMFVSLALCLSLSSEQKWVELPDGYEWESAPQGQPKFALSTISTGLLSSSLKEAIGLHWSGPELPERLEIFEVDLNGDGRREVFVSVPKLGGTGGGSYMILSPSGEGFRYLGAVLGFGFEFLNAEKGLEDDQGVE